MMMGADVFHLEKFIHIIFTRDILTYIVYVIIAYSISNRLFSHISIEVLRNCKSTYEILKILSLLD